MASHRKSNRPFIGVIIVTFNNERDIVACLTSLLAATEKIMTSIIVIDNASSDTTVSCISKIFTKKQLTLIPNSRNIGFAKAVNQGIKLLTKQGVQKILFLNPDTIVDVKFLIHLLQSQNDLVSPVISFKKGNTLYYDIGGRVNWLLGRQYNLLMNHRPRKSSNEVLDYLSGSCLLVDKKVFKKVGLFNEKYFLYFEDVDFCLRAKKAGFRMGVVADAIIFHAVSASSNAMPKLKRNNLIKSNLRFISGHVPYFFRPIAYVYLLLLSIKMAVDPTSKITVLHDH